MIDSTVVSSDSEVFEAPRKKARRLSNTDPNKPKHYESAYVLFTKDMIPRLKSDSTYRHEDIMKKVGSMWAILPAAEKEVRTI
jgi:hypothetical protein